MNMIYFNNDTLKNKKLEINSKTLLFKEQFKYLKTTHSYHLVDPSPWPAVASLGAFMITSGLVLYMHKFIGGWTLFQSGFLLTFFVMYTWWRDVVREATFEQQHSVAVQKGLRLGMVLFIVSEVMFFFAFFWAFFHSSLAPVYNIGGVWPPKAITPMDTYTIPLTNTFFLLTSGATVTWAHHALVARAKKQTLLALLFTLILAILFTSLQGLEYLEATFNISDGIYGSCFYMATGFHGFHVFVGTIALFVAFIRIVFNHFTNHHHFGFESAIWYWHFVDVVWLFLFINVYWWSNSGSDVNNSLPGPNSPSRLKILFWVRDYIDYIEQNHLELYFMSVLGVFVIMFLYLLIGLIVFYTKYSTTDFFLELKFFLKNQTNLFRKFQFIWFTCTAAIPAKVLILDFLTTFQTFIFVLFGFLCLHIFPLLTLIVCCHIFINFYSVIFIQLYNHSKSFKNYILKHWFNGSESFMHQYIVFFWGNPGKKLTERLVTAAASLLTGANLERARTHERNHVNTEVSRRMTEKKQNGVNWETPAAYNKDRAETEKQVIESDTTILYVQEKAKDGFETVKTLFKGTD